MGGPNGMQRGTRGFLNGLVIIFEFMVIINTYHPPEGFESLIKEVNAPKYRGKRKKKHEKVGKYFYEGHGAAYRKVALKWYRRFSYLVT